VADNETGVPLVTVPLGVTDSEVVVAVAGTAVTTREVVADVEPAKAAGSPGRKAALSARVPAASEVVVSEAVPPDTATGVPSADPPSENCTVPAAPDGETVAVG
jgi:hypothetical protein